MPRPQQNEDAASGREIDWRRRLERDRLLRQMTEESREEFLGPGAAGGGQPPADSPQNAQGQTPAPPVTKDAPSGKALGSVSSPTRNPNQKPPVANPADMQEMVKKIQLRAKFWYTFYYVLPLFAIIGLKLKDDDWLKKKAQGLTKSGGGGGAGGCAEYFVSKMDSCLMVEWCCAGLCCGIVMLIIFALVALLGVIGCGLKTAGGLLESFGISC